MCNSCGICHAANIDFTFSIFASNLSIGESKFLNQRYQSVIIYANIERHALPSICNYKIFRVMHNPRRPFIPRDGKPENSRRIEQILLNYRLEEFPILRREEMFNGEIYRSIDKVRH